MPPASASTNVKTDRKTLCLLLTVALAGVLAFDPFIGLLGPFTAPLADDKARHVLSFALLILPTAVLWRGAVPVMAAGLLVCGLLLELIQPVFGRESSFEDMLANVAGILIGIVLVSVGRKTIDLRMNRR